MNTFLLLLALIYFLNQSFKMKEIIINKYTGIRGIGTALDKPGCVVTLLLASQITLRAPSGEGQWSFLLCSPLAPYLCPYSGRSYRAH